MTTITLTSDQYSTLLVDQELLHKLTQQLRVVTIERDLLKQRVDAFLRQLFAAKSEARANPAQRDLFINEAKALAPTGQPAAEESIPDAEIQVATPHSREILANIETLLLQHLHGVLPNSLLGKALHYLSAQWPELIRFVENGGWPIDNNACENAIRPFVIGRRNGLFSDTVAGAQASANLYSLIETCKANGIEPYGYLITVFQQLPLAKTVEDFEALLPWQLKQIVIS